MTPPPTEHLVDGVLIAPGPSGLRMQCQTCAATELVLLGRERFDAAVRSFLLQHPDGCG